MIIIIMIKNKVCTKKYSPPSLLYLNYFRIINMILSLSYYKYQF